MGSFCDDWLWMVTTIMAVELDSVRDYSLIVNLLKRKTKKKTKFCARRPTTKTTWTIQEMIPVWGRRQRTLGSSLWPGLWAWRCWMPPTKEWFGTLAAGTLNWSDWWVEKSVEGRFTGSQLKGGSHISYCMECFTRCIGCESSVFESCQKCHGRPV